MNATAHTPSPWLVAEEAKIKHPEGTLIGQAQYWPDAYLMASAPDLLVAVQALLSMPDYDGTQPTSVTRRSAKHLARAAIAKATGEAT